MLHIHKNPKTESKVMRCEELLEPPTSSPPITARLIISCSGWPRRGDQWESRSCLARFSNLLWPGGIARPRNGSLAPVWPVLGRSTLSFTCRFLTALASEIIKLYNYNREAGYSQLRTVLIRGYKIQTKRNSERKSLSEMFI
jgi:hypothetical protein